MSVVALPLCRCLILFAVMVSLCCISNVGSAIEGAKPPPGDQMRILYCISPRVCRESPPPLHCLKGTEVPENGPLSILFMVDKTKCHNPLFEIAYDLEVDHHVSYSSDRQQEGDTMKIQQSLKQMQFDVVFNLEGNTGMSADLADYFITPSPSTTLYIDGGPMEFHVATFRRGGVIPAEKRNNLTIDNLQKWVKAWLENVRSECAPWNSIKPTPMPILLVMEPLGLKSLQDAGERIVKSLIYLSAAGLIILNISNPSATGKSTEVMNDVLRIGVGMPGGIAYRSNPHVFFDTNATIPPYYEVVRDGGIRVIPALLAIASENGVSPASAEEDALILRWKLLDAVEGNSDIYHTPLFDAI